MSKTSKQARQAVASRRDREQAKDTPVDGSKFRLSIGAGVDTAGVVHLTAIDHETGLAFSAGPGERLTMAARLEEFVEVLRRYVLRGQLDPVDVTNLAAATRDRDLIEAVARHQRAKK